MILKLLILVFLGLLSVVSPPVFIGIVTVVVASVMVCNFDISISKLNERLAARRLARKMKVPCNFLAIGILFPLAFALLGFAWDSDSQFAVQTYEVLRMCTAIVLHFCSLMILVGSMYKFVKLVD